MAQTALLIKDRKVVLATEMQDEKLIIFMCNGTEEYVPIKDDAQTQVFEELDQNEEGFHRNLRKDAVTHGHLVRQYCTNPEWSPDYEEDTTK